MHKDKNDAMMKKKTGVGNKSISTRKIHSLMRRSLKTKKEVKLEISASNSNSLSNKAGI